MRWRIILHREDRPTGFYLVCAAGLLWGTIGPAVSAIDQRSGLSILTIGSYRAVIALAVLAIAVIASRRISLCRSLVLRHPWRIAAVGLLTAAFQLLFFLAVITAGVSIATVVCLGFAPLLLLVITCIRHHRSPSAREFLTLAAALGGLALVSFGSNPSAQAENGTLGLIAALASGAAYALSTEIAVPLAQGTDALAVTATTMCAAACLLVIAGVAGSLLVGQASATTDTFSWLMIVYLGVTMATAYLLLFAGLRTVPSSAAVVVTLIEPIVAVLIAATLLGESLSAIAIVGCVLLLSAIAGLESPLKEAVVPQ
jgi:DME family drug/metabolite transporter